MKKHPYYIDQLNTYYNFILKPFVGKEYKGWEFCYEPMSGSFLFLKNDTAIYCTPYWEYNDGITISIVNQNGDYVNQNDILLQDVTGDSKLDSYNFFNLISKVIDDFES